MSSPIVHVEIIGREPARLRAFYAELFGWSPDVDSPVAAAVSDAGEYGFVTPPDDAAPVPVGIGGGPDHAPNTIFYVGVADVAATLDAAVTLGATAVMGPVERPDGALLVARFADPEGNVVGLAGPAGAA